MKATWDIFCDVVDNYGDIGVTWRLARQLASEHALQVRLWVNDMRAFVRLCPAAVADAAVQSHAGVEVHAWSARWQPVDVADVVIGAFACQLPDAYVADMAAQPRPPLWLNLDYLSAEGWVEGCHGLPSPQANGLRKVFFFPGFTPRTGGLLRERQLLDERAAFMSPHNDARAAFLAGLRIDPVPGARLLSLFAYENPALGEWLDALASDARPMHLLVPHGRILGDVQAWLHCEALEAGDVHRRGSLTVQVLPFVAQPDYDRLLWCCDFNAVRGEDSFVRAQWAARPMLWHIYVQEEYAHWEKLEAFLDLYTADLPAETAAALRDFWRAWNQAQAVGPAWQALGRHWPVLDRHAAQWCAKQAAQPDLATTLVQLYRNWL